MEYTVTDEEILQFLRLNWHSFPSQMALMQKAVRTLWPDGPPEEAGERVVRLCLEESTQRSAPSADPLPPSHGSRPFRARLGTMPL